MKKKVYRWIAAALVLCLGIAPVCAGAAGGKTAVLEYQSIGITVDGTKIAPVDVSGKAAEPFLMEGTVYLPLRAVAQALGCTVTWDGAAGAVDITSGGAAVLESTAAAGKSGTETATLCNRNIQIKVDGRKITPMDENGTVVEPFSVNGTTYLPLGAVESVLGCSVNWNEAGKTAEITSGAPAQASKTLKAGAGMAAMVFPQAYFENVAEDGTVTYEDGFCGAVHTFEGAKGEITDDLYTRVLLLEDELRVAIVALEVAQAPDDQVQYTKEIVGEICGVDPDNVWVHTTHQFGFMHRPSDTEKAKIYDELMKAAAKEAAQQAMDSFQDAVLGIGTGECHVSANKNITAPEEIGGGPYYGPGSTLDTDPTMTVLRFEALDGTPIGFFLSYGTKPSALCTTGKTVGNRQVNTEVTGHASKLMEEEYGAPCLFCMPAAGDQYPRETAQYYGLDENGEWKVIDIGFDEGIKIVDRLGNEMGQDAISIAKTIRCSETDADIQIAATYYMYENKAGDGEIKVTVDAITMGDVAFVGFKQEMDCLTGQQIQAGSPYGTTLLVSFLNGDGKYLGHKEAYDFNNGIGTWETKRSAFAVGAAEKFVEVADGLLDELYSGTYVAGDKQDETGDKMAFFSTVEFGGNSWYVLDKVDGKSLLLSEKVLEMRPYHDVDEAMTWETCSLRAYLNGEFYNSFTAQEKAKIVEVTNANKANAKYAISGGNDTVDKVFLLSLEEAELYLGGFGDIMIGRTKDTDEVVWWHLRSPGEAVNVAASVSAGGMIDYHGVGDFIDVPVGGVRPAMWVKLD